MLSAAPVAVFPPPVGAAAAHQQVVLCEVAGELRGIDIARVEEIIRLPEITPVPRARQGVVGVINLRGTIIPVVDLRRLEGVAPSVPTKSTRVVVVKVGEHTIGLIVDAVTEVLHLPAAIEPPSALVADGDTTSPRGLATIEGRLVLLLDLEATLSTRG
jgi:purine-binding chemotaxis protein CheW